MSVQIGYGKERLFSYQLHTTNPVFPKNKFHNSTYCNNLCNLCYFCSSKMYFLMTVELPCNQLNNTISLISQVLIGPYLIHSVHPPPPPPPPPCTFCWDLAGSQFLEGVAGKEGVTFFRGGAFKGGLVKRGVGLFEGG